MIYLDNAATTLHKPPCVIDAVVNAMQTMGNSGRSAHAESLAASRTIYAAREALAALFGCERADHVCFTANSTEALNIAISGLLAPGDHVLSTDLEHNSVLRPLYREMERGVSVRFLPADRKGCIDYADFDRLLQTNTKAVICAAGSNLTGNLLDLTRIGAFCAAHGLLFVVDASQTAGVFPIDLRAQHISARRARADCAWRRAGTSAHGASAGRACRRSCRHSRRSIPHGSKPERATATASRGCLPPCILFRRRAWMPSAHTSLRWPAGFTRA